MNLHEVTPSDLEGILRASKLLDGWTTAGGLTLHVAEYAGNDVLIVSDPASEEALIIEADDANYGGSIHEHARHARTLGTL